jgi:hypothetical protein
MSVEDAWESVFAMAQGNSGDGNSRKDAAATADHCMECPQPSKKAKRKPCTTLSSSSNSSSSSLEAYLSGRCSSTPDWSLHSSALIHSFAHHVQIEDLGSTLSEQQQQQHQPVCRKWKCKSTLLTTTALPTAACRVCSLPPGGHVWKRPLTSNTNSDALWNVYTSIRNIRCWCRSRLTFASAIEASSSSSSLPLPTRAAAVVVAVPHGPWLWTDLRDALAPHWNETKSSLDCAVAVPARALLEQHGPAVERRCAAVNENSHEDFECLVQCIMACDTVYYQVYYAQLTSTSAESINGSKEKRQHQTVPRHAIPHPVSYFGEWDGSGPSDEQNDAETSSTENALATLHHLRQAETATIFQDWMRRYPKVASSFHHWSKPVQSDKSFDALHATLAPPLLSAWRDSCRDFVCHLYSYATLTHATLSAVCDTMLRHDCTRILEVGAGTGYLAHVLSTTLAPRQRPSHAGFQTSGSWVTATDAVPDGNNEYHAATPAFVDCIHSGDSTRSKFWNQPFLAHHQNATTGLSHTVLLVCYPPPQSSMAVQTVRHFFEHCQGHLLIHIGEFKGLTGDSAFEQYLISHCCCLPQRWPCLLWGTDAAHVTIWERKKKDPARATTLQGKQSFAARQQGLANTARSLLLPCVHCGDQESMRRCRFLRSLTYCSKKCCLAHAMARQEALARAMIDVSALPALLDFDNPQHYSTLQWP